MNLSIDTKELDFPAGYQAACLDIYKTHAKKKLLFLLLPLSCCCCCCVFGVAHPSIVFRGSSPFFFFDLVPFIMNIALFKAFHSLPLFNRPSV